MWPNHASQRTQHFVDAHRFCTLLTSKCWVAELASLGPLKTRTLLMGKRKIWLLIARGVSAGNSGRAVSFYSHRPVLPAKEFSMNPFSPNDPRAPRPD